MHAVLKNLLRKALLEKQLIETYAQQQRPVNLRFTTHKLTNTHAVTQLTCLYICYSLI